jgi:hypothetical protein
MQVNAETLQKRIKSLQVRGNAEYALPLTLNEEYQLEAYKMLLGYLVKEPSVFMGVFHDGRGVAYYHTAKAAVKDGVYEVVPLYEDALID